MELLAEQAHAGRLELAALCDPRVPLGMLGDAGRIQQVLWNLVGNAVKLTERGEVVVRTRLGEHAAGRASVRFEVTDAGIGIGQEAAARLFQRLLRQTARRRASLVGRASAWRSARGW